MKLTPGERALLRNRFGGRCAYCGIHLPEKGWHADHVKAVWRELRWATGKDGYYKLVPTGRLYRPEHDTKENLFPTCMPCNVDKSSVDLDDWRKSLEQRVEVCRRNHSAFRHAERFGRLVVTKEPLVFWFEKYAILVKNGARLTQRAPTVVSLCVGEMR